MLLNMEIQSNTTHLTIMLLQVGSFLLLLSYVEGENLVINWTDAGVSNLVSSTASLDPPVLSLTPCPCDLTSGTCDLGCCCDEDCSEFERGFFICQEGLEGGHEMDKHPDYVCQYRGPYSPEWHDLLCIVAENTPYLGHFYHHEPVIRDFQKYLSRVRVPSYSYEDTSYHAPQLNFHQYYMFGSTVETILPSSESGFRGVLSLPQQLLNGVCVRTVPIHFLEEFSYRCPLAVSPNICQTEALLSPATYLREADRLISDPLLEVSQVIGNLTSLARVYASVEYECLVDDTAKFIKRQHQKGKEFSDFGEGEEGHLDMACKGSDLPHYNSTSQKCENVVLSVEYNFGWSGPSITEINTKIKIGNIPVSLEPSNNLSYKASQKRKQSSPNQKPPKMNKFPILSASPKLSLVQHFTVSFHHTGSPHVITQNWNGSVMAIEGNMTVDEEDLTIGAGYSRPGVERSGNPGYQLGRPLMAGYAVYSDPLVDHIPADNVLASNNTAVDNSTAEQTIYVDMNGTTGLFTLSPGASGECQKTELERVIFGIDMISACQYHWTDTYYCNQLREELTSLLRSLIQADVVAKLGWPNTTVESDFLTIIVDDGETLDSNNDEAVSGGSITNESEPVYNEGVKGGTVPNENGAVKGIAGEECRVPHALAYRVVYQDIAEPPTNPVYQLVGVLARFHLRDIQLRVDTSTGQIPVTTSVTFINSPRPSGLSSFWERMEDRWCSGGTCWREVLWPWTHGEGVHTTHLTSLLANTVLLLVLAVPVVIMALSPR